MKKYLLSPRAVSFNDSHLVTSLGRFVYPIMQFFVFSSYVGLKVSMGLQVSALTFLTTTNSENVPSESKVAPYVADNSSAAAVGAIAPATASVKSAINAVSLRRIMSLPWVVDCFRA